MKKKLIWSKYLEYYAWITSGFFLIVNLLRINDKLRESSFMVWMDEFFFETSNAPTECVQIVLLITILIQIIKIHTPDVKFNPFKWATFTMFVFVFGEEISWGQDFFDVHYLEGIFTYHGNDLHSRLFLKLELTYIFYVIGAIYLSIFTFSSEHFLKFKNKTGAIPTTISNNMANLYMFSCIADQLDFFDWASCNESIFINNFYVIFLTYLLKLNYGDFVGGATPLKIRYCYAATALLTLHYIIVMSLGIA